MQYAKGFFDLQLEFAETVSVVSGQPLARTVLDYTNLYIRFGLGRDFDPANAAWHEYLAGLLDADDRREWTYRFYATRRTDVGPPGVVAAFGCFSYARPSEDCIRLHFHDADVDGGSPLAIDRRDKRLTELAALFGHVTATTRGPLRVIGVSWLYNISAYRRLFPDSYLATARPAPRLFRHMPLWGQFLDRRGEVREESARQFRARLQLQSSAESLDRCFPLPVLSLETAALDFYRFYGV